MAALIIAIFPQNSSRGNWEEQQDRTDPNSRFELARKPAWLLAFRQFGLPKWKHDFESREPLADWCPRRSEQAGSSPIFRGGQPYFGRNAKISSMVRIVLKRPFCLGFARIFGKMQDEMQDKREPACPHGNWAGADQPASRSRKMRDLSPILRTNSRKYSVLYNPQLFSGDGSFTIPMPKRRT